MALFALSLFLILLGGIAYDCRCEKEKRLAEATLAERVAMICRRLNETE